MKVALTQSIMGDDLSVRYRNTILIDDDGNRHLGDFLIHQDGSWSNSNGDEDVQTNLNGKHKLLTRTFQNWHTHLAMTLNARDFSDGYPLQKWLEKAIFPTEAKITPDHVKFGVRAAAAEMIRTGSSFASDMYFYPATAGKVIDELGIRALLGGPVSDIALPSHTDAKSALAEMDDLLLNNHNSRVNYSIATHSVYLCGEETLIQARDLAKKHDAVCHIHVAETRKEVADCHEKTGMYPVQYLDSIDFLQEGTICAHSSWVKKDEMRMMAERRVKAVHCPTSNMKLACGGTLSLPAYQEAGVDVRLGTDGSASSGSGLDMRVEAKFASLIQRHDHWDSTILPAKDIFKLATKDSKDWAAWNLNDIRMNPIGRSSNRHLGNLIFSGADCLDMWVDGKAIRQDGKTLTLDETQVIDELNQIVYSYYDGVE